MGRYPYWKTISTCPTCGHEIAKKVVDCDGCGETVDYDKAHPYGKRKKRGMIIRGHLCADCIKVNAKDWARICRLEIEPRSKYDE